MKDIWEDRILGAPGLCRKTHRVEVVGLLAARCILTRTCEGQPRRFPAPNAARTCPHLHSKVDIHPPLKKVTVSKAMVMCVNRVLAMHAVLAATTLVMLTGYKLIADSGNQNTTSDNKAF